MMKSSAQNTRAGFGDRFIAFANKVSDVSGLVAAYLLVPLVVVFLIEIVSRNVFNHPTTWASGTCFLIGGCAAVLGFGYALKSGAMVRIDALSSKLPEKAHCILDLILYAVLFLPLTIGGAYECIKNAVVSVSKLETLSTGSWNAPIWPTKIVSPSASSFSRCRGWRRSFSWCSVCVQRSGRVSNDSQRTYDRSHYGHLAVGVHFLRLLPVCCARRRGDFVGSRLLGSRRVLDRVFQHFQILQGL